MNVVAANSSRRRALQTGAIAALAAFIAPKIAFADVDALNAALKKAFGDKKPSNGKVKLDIPEIAENGLVVPVTVDVESPMTEANYVKAVHVFADGNPQPEVVSYHFTPACGKASASTRMRLAQTQNVVCFAEMSDGSLYSTSAQVKVTIGGCGG